MEIKAKRTHTFEKKCCICKVLARSVCRLSKVFKKSYLMRLFKAVSAIGLAFDADPEEYTHPNDYQGYCKRDPS